MLYRCQHTSTSTACVMVFAIFLPITYSSTSKTTPSLYFLSGLTCTDQNFCQKAGPVAFARAEEHGLALVMPDTSPRGDGVANDDKYDLGQGASFYINATAEPWKAHYQMETYIQKELPALINGQFPGLSSKRSITGHSMGGHGALTLAFKSRLAGEDGWISVSALSPVCHPTACPWGKKAFENYFGAVDASCKAHDATELLQELLASGKLLDDILIDQGLGDEFLAEQLSLDDFEAACAGVGQKLTARRHEGMDHSYYFIAACIADHVDFHAEKLQ
jgi:S-formylglutathione hydrolase